MISLRCVLPAAVVLAMGLWTGTASADCGSGFGVGNCWFGNLNAYGASGTLYGSGYLHVPPYYAIHPPVYYSHQYYRPYGWSPFAQSSWQGAAVLRPEPRPEVIINPHVREVEEARPAPAANDMAKAQWIINPHVAQANTTGQGRLVVTQQ